VTTLATDLYLLIAAYGLAMPVSYAGLPVLGQGAFVSVGAFGTVQLAQHGMPLLVAVMAAAAAAALVGYLVGFAATRLAGASLALATWGLAWLAYVALVEFPNLSGGSQGLVRTTPAQLRSPALGVTVVLHPWVHVVVVAIVSAALAVMLVRATRGPLGLDWAALRTGPALADSIGVPVQRRRRALLSWSAALGAFAGAGTAILTGVVAPVDYSPLLSLQLFVAVIVGGVATWWGPIVGVGLLAALPSTADGIASAAGIDPTRARGVVTAVLLVVALVARQPVRRLLASLSRRAAPSDVDGGAEAGEETATSTVTAGAPVVALRGISVRFGAVVVLDGLDLDVRAGEVHALVGPNGSGKSTALRVAAGVVVPAQGSVEINGNAAPRAGSAAPRVLAGVARTLQRTATLGDLTAASQVAIGARAADRHSFLGVRHLLATPVATRAHEERTQRSQHALQLTGLAGSADTAASRLDSAEQRRLQIARAVATGAPALLIDEPAAGMSAQQRDALAGVLRELADRGHGVLLVEHDMTLVGRVADRVTVLAEGRVLASGTAEEVRRDPAVRRAYLGEVDDVMTKEHRAR